ncbi:MAG: glycerate kinase [Clostridiales bacterium]|nr:glycerate kinase [Clostridiales bacterium]
MKVLVSMDSFKGSCSAQKAGEAVCAGILKAFPQAKTVNLPVADGGEGTVDAVLAGLEGAERRACRVTGPLGDLAEAVYAITKDRAAVIEMSAASGILLIPTQKLDAMNTTTYGVGEMILSALDQGCTTIIMGLGGSATNDGGAGMAQALGASLRDKAGKELAFGGGALRDLHTVDLTNLDPRLKDCRFLLASDVCNPLCGDIGASAVFGPQKGASPQQVKQLDQGLANWAIKLAEQTGTDMKDAPGAGAAGGLGGGMLALLPAKFHGGIHLILDMLGFDAQAKDADWVVTGEGKLDAQTVYGKVPVGVAQRAKAQGCPLVTALVGCIGAGAEAVYEHGIDGVYCIADKPMTYAFSVAHVEALLKQTSEALARTIVAAGGANRRETNENSRM